MFVVRKPSTALIRDLISQQQDLPFSYDEVGATRGELPAGYVHDHNRIQLGVGVDVFERAVDALKRWLHFDLGWVGIVPDDAPLEVGTTVVIKARKFGVWSLNAARIVYTINDAREVTRFGFANGTLPGHVERGEEQFLIEWNATNGSVWYGLTPFSKPQHPLVKLAARLGRSLQKRFAKESLRRMQNITQKAGP